MFFLNKFFKILIMKSLIKEFYKKVNLIFIIIIYIFFIINYIYEWLRVLGKKREI